MTRLKLVSTKIPADWVDRLEESTRLTGLTQSALVRKAIGQYLGLETVDSVDRVDLVDPLRSEIDDIKARLTTLERSTGLTMVDPKPPIVSDRPEVIAIVTKSSTPKPPKTIATRAMRTSELLAALKAKGYTRSMASLLRALNKAIEAQVVPDELAVFGVCCDFELKRSSNPLSGTVRWLSIQD